MKQTSVQGGSPEKRGGMTVFGHEIRSRDIKMGLLFLALTLAACTSVPAAAPQPNQPRTNDLVPVVAATATGIPQEKPIIKFQQDYAEPLCGPTIQTIDGISPSPDINVTPPAGFQPLSPSEITSGQNLTPAEKEQVKIATEKTLTMQKNLELLLEDEAYNRNMKLGLVLTHIHPDFKNPVFAPPGKVWSSASLTNGETGRIVAFGFYVEDGKPMLFYPPTGNPDFGPDIYWHEDSGLLVRTTAPKSGDGVNRLKRYFMTDTNGDGKNDACDWERKILKITDFFNPVGRGWQKNFTAPTAGGIS